MLALTYVVAVLLCSRVVSGFPYVDDDLSLESQDGDVDTISRAKRINEMACYCCSNSFNSNCCYKCMKSMGKRSNLVSDTQPPSVSKKLSKDMIDVKEKEIMQEINYCVCCILEQESDSSMSTSNCCTLCSQDARR